MSPPEPLTVTDAAPLIRSGALTPSDLLEQCLARVDVYEPAVKAWVYLDRERARRDAARLTDELKQGHHRGPLHGIPVGIKDIIDVFDMPTGCGSKLWANSFARRDAACVERLRQAGAVILGKTVTTPYAFTDPPVTRNPWNLDRTPGGSSSGSAAAVACGMCLAALGTQTGGSLTRPASYCGVCSLKPTYGRVSVDGVLPLAPSLDHVGVIAGCVRDLAIVLQCIAGPVRWEDIGDPVPDCIRAVDQRILSHTMLKVGGLFDELLSSDASTMMNGAVKHIESNWATVPSVVLPGSTSELLRAHRWIMACESAAIHAERWERLPDEYPPNITALVQEGLSDTQPPNRSYLLHSELRRTVSGMLRRNHFFLTPATTDVAPTIETTGNPVFNVPWSFTGMPTVSLPYARTPDGLPFAIQLAGGNHREDEVLRAAFWCEEEFQFPRTLPPIPSK